MSRDALYRCGRAFLLLSCLVPLGGVGVASDDDPFPEYPSIRPNVEFWARVFSEWSLGQVAVHDLDHPGVVYEVVDLPGPVSYTHLTLPTTRQRCRSRWSPYH